MYNNNQPNGADYYQQPQAPPPPQQYYQQPQPPQQQYYPPPQQQYQQPQQQQYYPQQQQQVQQPQGQFGGAQYYSHLLQTPTQIDLLKTRTSQLLPPYGVKPPEVRFNNEVWKERNASPEIFRCTVTKIPETKELLKRCRLPLGILIHPFKDLTHLPVIQCSTIVRCRSCRTYINPFVYFIDNRRWKCNLCFRANDLPDEFQYDPLSKTYGDPNRRPEVLSGTIEFLAPADYMVRPPQPSIYLFLLETSPTALQSGYLKLFCDILLENLENLPGDSRMKVGFIGYGCNTLEFYSLSPEEAGGAVKEIVVVTDAEGGFIPVPTEQLLVKLDVSMESVKELLNWLPKRQFDVSNASGGSCLGAAVQIGQKMLASTGGRLTIISHTLPTVPPGDCKIPPMAQPEPSLKSLNLNPTTDFYKKLALDCSTNYIAADLFFLGSGHQDIASVSCIAKHSGGSIYRVEGLETVQKRTYFEGLLTRYLTRKIGFEAVMRVRCSRGLSIHSFHGHLFVRSTDLLSLPNCNPDSGFGMQVSIDEDLRDYQHVAFQAALLYTSSKGERRIRVHTLCLPIASNLQDILLSADQQAIIGLLGKMGVDRALESSIPDAREAFTNAVIDILGVYGLTQNVGSGSGFGGVLLAPNNVLQMLPVWVHGLLRGVGFSLNPNISVDSRSYYFTQIKSLPLCYLMQLVYPDLYRIDNVLDMPLREHDEPEDDQQQLLSSSELPHFPLLPLTSAVLQSNATYLLDTPHLVVIYVCRATSPDFLQDVLNVASFSDLTEGNELPELDNVMSERVRAFVGYLVGSKVFPCGVRIVREDSRERGVFISNLVEDRALSKATWCDKGYYEWLQEEINK